MDTSNRSVANEGQVYAFIVEYTTENLFPPTVNEIRDGTSIQSTCTIHNILGRLESKGLIKLKRNSTRGIKLIGYRLIKGE